MARANTNWTPGTSPGFLDAAETFGESDVTLGHTNTQMASEAVSLQNETTGSAASRDADNNSLSRQWKGGLEISPNEDLDGVDAVISSLTAGFTTAYLQEPTSGGTVYDQVDISGKSSGESVRLTHDLQAGSNYWVVMDAGGSTYMDHGKFDNSPSFPYTSTMVDIEYGVYDTSDSGTNAVDYEDIIPVKYTDKTTGTATVEWPYPPDVYDWDVAKFQATKDGETADVYVEEYDGSSWTEIAGPISRGDDLPADPGRNVRYRVELSRASTSNNPTLDAIYRRYTV